MHALRSAPLVYFLPRFGRITLSSIRTNSNALTNLEPHHQRIHVQQFRKIHSCQHLFKEKSKKSKTKGKVKSSGLSDDELKEVFDVDDFRQNLATIRQEFQENLKRHFSLRTKPASFNDIPITLGRKTYPLDNIAQISMKSPQVILINCSAIPDQVQTVVKALEECGMNLNPQLEGSVVYVPIPKVSREHREKLIKGAKEEYENCKKKIRQLQNKSIEKVKLVEHHSQDLVFKSTNSIMAIAEQEYNDLMLILEEKKKELLS